MKTIEKIAIAFGMLGLATIYTGAKKNNELYKVFGTSALGVSAGYVLGYRRGQQTLTKLVDKYSQDKKLD